MTLIAISEDVLNLAMHSSTVKAESISLASAHSFVYIINSHRKMAPPPPPPPPPPPVPDDLGFEAVLAGLSNGTAEENLVCIPINKDLGLTASIFCILYILLS